MNPLDTMKAGAAGLTEKLTGENPKLLVEVTKLVQNMPDGFNGLMKQFQDRGLGNLVTSLKANTPVAITPDDMAKGFGSDNITMLAKNTGMDATAVQTQLATLMPKLVHQLGSFVKV